MNTTEQIREYIENLPSSKRAEILNLHSRILQLLPNCRLWYLDGKDENGKVVSNPQIGYGFQILKYADGRSRAFYQTGISSNQTGISVYVMGLKDKNHLREKYAKSIGKATVTGYCIKFKSLKDINLSILESAILDGAEQTGEK